MQKKIKNPVPSPLNSKNKKRQYDKKSGGTNMAHYIQQFIPHPFGALHNSMVLQALEHVLCSCIFCFQNVNFILKENKIIEIKLLLCF